jgi:IS5 family transposase
MRRTFNPQPELDVLPIERIVIPQSRDELPPVLAGLQWLWNQSELRTQIFALLTAKVMVGKKSTGRTGMELWRILVFGVVRLALDADWDRLEHIANHDRLVREILGLGALDRQTFHRRTLRDNVALLDAPLLLEINALIAKAGRELFSPKVKIEARVDSYVLETDVHFPTDFNLLWDAGRKCLDLIAHFQKRGFHFKGWRKWSHWRTQLKAAERTSSRASAGGGKNKDERVKKLTADYLEIARELAEKVRSTHAEILAQCTQPTDLVRLESLKYFLEMLDKHIDLLDRRVLKGEIIPNSEKIYSLFEPHTQWISKGKRNVELGRRFLVTTDQNQLVLAYKVPAAMDLDESLPMTNRVLELYGQDSVASISFDKGFTASASKEAIELHVPLVVMPKRGKKTEAQAKEEKAPKYTRMRRAHSAVESAINALEHHGLDRCLDVGEEAFERYAGYGVMAYNLHLIGRRLLGTIPEEESLAA